MRKVNFSFGTQQVSPFKEEKGNFDGISSEVPSSQTELLLVRVCCSRCFVGISSPNRSGGILGHQCVSALHCLLGLRNADVFFPKRPPRFVVLL